MKLATKTERVIYGPLTKPLKPVEQEALQQFKDSAVRKQMTFATIETKTTITAVATPGIFAS